MKWVTLWKKIGKQPLKKTQHQDVYALIETADGKTEQINLALKFDKSGNPYFIKETKHKTP